MHPRDGRRDALEIVSAHSSCHDLKIDTWQSYEGGVEGLEDLPRTHGLHALK